jgi:hypothetical protein
LLLIDVQSDVHPNSHAKIDAVMPKLMPFLCIQTVNYFEGCPTFDKTLADKYLLILDNGSGAAYNRHVFG